MKVYPKGWKIPNKQNKRQSLINELLEIIDYFEYNWDSLSMLLSSFLQIKLQHILIAVDSQSANSGVFVV